jgi:hypothetical protein
MAITSSDIKALGTEFSGLSDSMIETYIGIAQCLISEDAWGCCYSQALSLMTAHLVTLGARAGVGGPVTSERVGDLSRSYGTLNSGTGDINELAQTSYGTMLSMLRRAQFRTPFCV